MKILSVLLAGQPGGNPIQFWIMIGLMIVVFYFFIIRPQNKRQKEIKKFQESIQPGTEVVTSGGILGKVREIKDKYFVIEIADNVRIKVEKASVFAAPSSENATK
jgi:preprotein translocase subunit YajC